jgi:phosphohistidine swiveling domain-containing protein
LKLREIGAVIGGVTSPNGLRAIVDRRAAEQERYAAIDMPLLMRPSELAGLIRMAGVSGGAEEGALTGHAVSVGCVEGEVVVVRDPGDFGRMKRSMILVAPATDPSWTHLFTLASGVIVEVGGVLSHASTIAREYGLPAVANVKHATRRLRTGERVRLDAINGVVHHLEASASLAS